MHKLRPTLTAAALAATALSLLAGAGPASAAATCTVDQLTAVTGGGSTLGDLAISGDGNRVAFRSNHDLTGHNADHNFEIFLFDVAEDELVQITETASPIQNNTPALTGNGHVVAYSSNGNAAGSNGDGNYEIFRWIEGAMFPITAQVTNTGTGGSYTPSVSADGDKVAFETSADIGGANPDGGMDVVLYDVSANALTPITSDLENDSEAPDVSADGTRVAFLSEGDPAGVEEDLGYPEVYTYGTADSTVRQVTHTVDGVIQEPSISADGTRIAFVSPNGFGAPNPGVQSDAFVADTRAGTTSAMTFATTDDEAVQRAVLDGTGRRVVVVNKLEGRDAAQSRDLGGAVRNGVVVPGNATNDEEVDVDQSGTRIATISNGNPTGQNVDGTDEVFLSTCSAPPAAPTCNGLYASVRFGLGDRPTTGNDVIVGTPGVDAVNAKGGNDRFCGLGGNDTFNGGNGDDRAAGGAGNDRLRGDAGDDRLVGDAGNDVLQGGAGPDTCQGGPGQDTASTCTTRIGIP